AKTPQRIVDFGSLIADLQQGSAINIAIRRYAERRLRACVCAEERGFGDRRKTNSSTNVFDVTRDLVIRHHTYLDLIECLVVMNAGIPVTGEATTHDRAEDVDVAC